MRNTLPYFALAFLLFSGWNFYKSQNPSFSGISDAAAVPANIHAIQLDEIKSFLSADTPRVLFLYASWCGYCKKQIEGFKYFQQQYPTDKILAISTDRNPGQLVKYLESQEHFPFDAYIYQGGSELKDYLQAQGATFKGAIPYFAIFEKGQFKQEFLGLTHPESLAEITAK